MSNVKCHLCGDPTERTMGWPLRVVYLPNVMPTYIADIVGTIKLICLVCFHGKARGH